MGERNSRTNFHSTELAVAGKNRVDGTDAARLFDGADPGIGIVCDISDQDKRYRTTFLRIAGRPCSSKTNSAASLVSLRAEGRCPSRTSVTRVLLESPNGAERLTRTAASVKCRRRESRRFDASRSAENNCTRTLDPAVAIGAKEAPFSSHIRESGQPFPRLQLFAITHRWLSKSCDQSAVWRQGA